MWHTLRQSADWVHFKIPISQVTWQTHEICLGRNELRFWSLHTCTYWSDLRDADSTHSSTEGEIISLDAGFRSEGILALILRDMVIDA